MELIRKITPGDERYLSDESRVMGAAEYIAFPASAGEISSVIRWCADHHVPLTAQGGLTGLAGGASPARGLALNLQRMNKILGLRRGEQGEYYLRVQPGLLLTQLRKALETKSFDVRIWDDASLDALKTVKPGALFFSPDPTEPTASLGGMASCNACGARSVL